MTLKGRQRAGFLGDKGQVAKEAGITTARMITQLERAVLDVAATTEEVRASSVTASTGTASISVRYNSGTPAVGVRPQLNFIPGAGITLTVTDDNADDEVDVTVASSAGFGTPVSVDLAANSAGVATTYSRSDHKHDLDESISPTWTGSHVWESEAAGEHRIGTSYPCDLYTDTVSGVFTLSTPGGSFWIRPHSNSLLQLGRGASTYWRIYDDSLAAATSFQIDVSTGSPGSVVFRADDGLGGAANLDLTGAAVYIGTTTCSANGTWTFSSESKHPAGLEVGTTAVSGRFDSATNDATGLSHFLFQPTNSISGSDRWRFRFNDSSGNPQLVQWPSNFWEFAGVGGSTTDAVFGVQAAITKSMGCAFAPQSTTAAGVTSGVSGNFVGGAFVVQTAGSTTPSHTAMTAGAFTTNVGASQGSNQASNFAVFMLPGASWGTGNDTRTWTDTGGFHIFSCAVSGKNKGTFTNIYGGLIENMGDGATGSGTSVTNMYGLYIKEQTRAATINNGIFLANATSGRKLIVLRDQSAYLGADAAGQINYMGGHAVSSVTKTGDYTATASDHVILCNATSASFTITLPAASGATGRIYRVKKIDTTANTVTIDANASETIDDATTQVLSTAYDSVDIICDGTEWWII